MFSTILLENIIIIHKLEDIIFQAIYSDGLYTAKNGKLISYEVRLAMLFWLLINNFAILM